ncbi:MAG: glucose-6-phosphate isomerase [Christensenellales bacterium]|jgi:glucose-6-phosphate isomerase
MEHRLKFDFNNMMSYMLGSRGVAQAEVDLLAERLKKAMASLKEKRAQLAWMDLPYSQQPAVSEINREAKAIRSKFDTFVVLGIGGSALGPIAVHQALNHLHYNDLSRDKRKGPRLFIEDNIDPERMQALLDILDPKRTAFNVITKSGSTSETMSQLLIINDWLKKTVGKNYASHIYATTDARNGNLIRIAKQNGYKTFIIPEGVGGRFSELCPVGLLPAAVCGIDIGALLAGAADMDVWCQEPDMMKNPAYLGAALQYCAMQKGYNISVMMPYADSLKYFADWYAQLWAESLGKRFNNQGKEIHAGQTPVKALGVTDQHSQVQLYVEGPFDKTITFLGVGEYRARVEIPAGFEEYPDVSFLSGYTLNELIRAELAATEYALLKAGKMNSTITLPVVNECTIGQLIYYFEMQTAVVGELMDINAYDQPGVEEGKNATYALLGRKGFEEKRAELMRRPERKPQYIL